MVANAKRVWRIFSVIVALTSMHVEFYWVGRGFDNWTAAGKVPGVASGVLNVVDGFEVTAKPL